MDPSYGLLGKWVSFYRILHDMTNIEFKEKDNTSLHTGLVICCVILPLVGLILYFVHKSESPKKSTDACYAAIGGMVLNTIIQIAAGA